MPAARLDMRPAVVESPTVEADTGPGCLDRLTLDCTDKGQSVAASEVSKIDLLLGNSPNHHVLAGRGRTAVK